MTTLLYKTKEPVVYNKGTIYEKREDTFLHSYYRTQEEAQNYVDELNATHPDRAWNGEKIRAVVLCATLVYELVGPLLTKMVLTRAGEIVRGKDKGNVSDASVRTSDAVTQITTENATDVSCAEATADKPDGGKV